MDNSDTPLTHDEHREASSEMLDGTKDLTQNTVKMIGEGIQNDNKNLQTILFTLVWLSTFGFSYFKGHFADRGRYENLVCPFTGFFQMILNKLVELNLPQIANRLLINKDKVIQYLKQNRWTRADISGHEWVRHSNYHMYGRITNDDLRNTNGVYINKFGKVHICYHNQDGDPTTP